MRWRILIVTGDRAPLENASTPLVSRERITVTWTEDFESTLAAVKKNRPDLLIVDSRIQERNGLDLCREVMRFDAFVNMAAISELDEDEFHEASEGLGLIGRLPPRPSVTDLESLLALLEVISPSVGAPPR